MTIRRRFNRTRSNQVGCPLLASGQLPVVQALELGQSIAGFSLHQKYHDLELLSEWAAGLESPLRLTRKQIYALTKVTNKKVVERERSLIERTVMPLPLAMEQGATAVYPHEERLRDIAEYDAHVAGQLERQRELRREERRLVSLRDWAEERQEQILATINPLIDWFTGRRSE